MDNTYAFRLSKAVREASKGGDFIDHGWALVRRLNEAGFDITPHDRGPAGMNPAKTLNEMCGIEPKPEETEG